MEKKIQIHYGALAKPIEEQLNKQDFTLGEKQEFINKLVHALTMCQFHLMTDSQYNACMKKLHKKVMDSIEPLDM